MLSKIKSLSESVFPYAVDCYRYLHANPELSFQEFETSLFVQNQLTEIGIPFRAEIGGTGILGKIQGKNPAKRVIALRADMDALPIQEQVELPWKSKNANVMHACGHDAHTACLLAAAKILNSLRNEFEGTILLVFQPGEERSPGGANLMLKDGVFDELEPEIIIGQHVSEDYPTGSMAFRSGSIMASADEIHVSIRGRGGHGAKPHLINDTVLAAAQTLVSLQQVKSRLCPPLTPMVLSFGKLIADGTTNVIPNEVQMSGTFRTYDEIWRKQAKAHIRRIITETCAAYGCNAEIDMPEGYPFLKNDEEITRQAKKFATELVGAENVLEFDQRLTSEDFAFFSQRYPACFYRFGIKGESNADMGRSHTPTFRIDEEALLTGTSELAWLVWKFLQ
ncbi:MAG TPA: amidohydrolase [Bacteroidales bacterium]|nr:amidohydrolase [Bacteroidales bacterium]